jgi:hypothetical protein
LFSNLPFFKLKKKKKNLLKKDAFRFEVNIILRRYFIIIIYILVRGCFIESNVICYLLGKMLGFLGVITYLIFKYNKF